MSRKVPRKLQQERLGLLLVSYTTLAHASCSPLEILAKGASYGLRCSTESRKVWALAVVSFAAQFRDE